MQMTKRTFKLLVITFVVLTTLSMCNVKTDSLDYIRLEIEHSRRIPNNKVDIEIKKEKEKYLLHIESLPLFKTKEWEKTIIDTSFEIEEKDFRKISDEIPNIIKSDFTKSDVVGLDGATYSLKFKFNGKEKEYNFWTPDYDTKERGLTNYLKICKLIIETAGLKEKEVL